MLRIGSGEAPPELPMEPETEAPMPVEPEAKRFSAQMVSPMVAGYKGPELGPFACGNCEHWNEDGSCDIVAGPIHPEGVCNLFEPIHAEEDGEAMPEDVMPMEEPIEGQE